MREQHKLGRECEKEGLRERAREGKGFSKRERGEGERGGRECEKRMREGEIERGIGCLVCC